MRLHPGSTLTSTVWSRPALAVGVLALSIALALPLLRGGEGGALSALAQATSPGPSCGLWDDQVTATIAERVRASKGDDELRQLADAIFRLRRARRNCAEGWVGIACRDYQAIMRAAPAPSGVRPLFVTLSACGGDVPRVPSEAQASR
jgi:hypothetical protein